MTDVSAIEIVPLTGAFGAEIHGIDITQQLSDESIAAVRRVFLNHHVVVLRGQDPDPAALTAFGARFGRLEDYPFVAPLPDHPQVIPVIKEADEKANFGGGWHTDLIYTPEPPLGTMLQAVEVPARGGDTMFACGQLALAGLTDRMRTLLEGLTVQYSVKHAARAIVERSGPGDVPGSRSMPKATDAAVVAATPEHPLVRRHPETGVAGLYFSREHTNCFAGMSVQESQPLLDWLQIYMTQPKFTTRLQWQPGTIAFWDNRCVSHYALNDYHGQRRHMQRLTIAGDKPIAAGAV